MAFIYDLTDTWNAGGTTFNAIKMNVTDSASAAASKLVTLQVGGSERFGVRKDGQGYFAGNVGIGTSSPVNYSGYSTLTIQNTNGGVINLRNGGNTAQAEIAVTSAETYMAAVSALPLTFKTTNTERMRIDSSGNVGIGTSSPDAKLRVVGTAKIGEGVATNTAKLMVNTVAGVSAGLQLFQDGTESWIIQNPASSTALAFANSGTERMRITSAGNVGIGTTSPADKLHVEGNLYFGTSSRTIYATGSADLIFQNNTGSMVFSRANGASESMRIDSSGNLLVGTTTGGGTGVSIYNAGNNSNVGRIDIGKSFSGSATGMSFRYNGTTVGSIVYTDTATSYVTSSDYRLKDIDGPIQNSGAYIDALKPVQGSWKADGSRFIGLLAHEVQEVSETQIATGEKDGEQMQAMDYSAPEIIANLIAEIQSLRARVAQLEGN